MRRRPGSDSTRSSAARRAADSSSSGAPEGKGGQCRQGNSKGEVAGDAGMSPGILTHIDVACIDRRQYLTQGWVPTCPVHVEVHCMPRSPDWHPTLAASSSSDLLEGVRVV